MLKIQKYTQVQSLDEAYQIINKNRNNLIIGGMIWIKMEDRFVPEAVDLSLLGLDKIEELEDEFQIGCMCTLRQIEIHKELNDLCHNVLKDAICDIVGVQLRNMATIGGSIYSRFGFSDVLTALMCLDCDVILFKKGRMSLKEFVNLPFEKDIITHVCIKKRQYHSTFVCVRRSATDISVLNMSLTQEDDYYRVVVGARPQKALYMEVSRQLSVEEIIIEVKKNAICEGNMRASQEYREKLVEALLIKGLKKLED